MLRAEAIRWSLPSFLVLLPQILALCQHTPSLHASEQRASTADPNQHQVTPPLCSLSTQGQSPYGSHRGVPSPVLSLYHLVFLAPSGSPGCDLGKNSASHNIKALALVLCVAGGSSPMSKGTLLCPTQVCSESPSKSLSSVLSYTTSANHAILSLPDPTPFSKAIINCVRIRICSPVSTLYRKVPQWWGFAGSVHYCSQPGGL